MTMVPNVIQSAVGWGWPRRAARSFAEFACYSPPTTRTLAPGKASRNQSTTASCRPSNLTKLSVSARVLD
jgi:hypothetical protein